LIQLIHGDCLIENEKIESGSVDLILTDLPYGTMNGYNGINWDFAISPEIVYNIANRTLRKNGKMILFSQEPYTTELIKNSLPNLSFSYRAIWEKDNFANALLCNKAMVSYYEDILIFSKGGFGEFGEDNSYRDYINEQRKLSKLTLDEMCGLCGLNIKGHGGVAYHWCSSKQPTLIPKKHYITLRYKTGNFKRVYSELKEIYTKSFLNYQSTFNLWEGKKYKSNILKYKKDYNGFHPTQKPILLLEDLIKTFSNENNLVVDLTMGSGSTGVACKNTNRNFIGIEKEKKYFDIANDRINKASPVDDFDNFLS
jgi:site-specific DNA-methyltransferase (adenine-specific)